MLRGGLLQDQTSSIFLSFFQDIARKTTGRKGRIMGLAENYRVGHPDNLNQGNSALDFYIKCLILHFFLS